MSSDKSSVLRHETDSYFASKNLNGDEKLKSYQDREAVELYSRTIHQKEEIQLLREQIAAACCKELQLLNEKYALERKLSDLRLAIDEKQNEGINSASKELARRKGDLEEHYKLAHDLKVEAYSDSDYGSSTVDRRSTSGYCTFVGGTLVTWRSKKQNAVARSSAETEFRAMAQGICKLLWIKILLTNLKIELMDTMRLYCDNQAAINIVHNPVLHDRTKHIEIDRHFIKEKMGDGVICTLFLKSGEQLADILTKGLTNRSFSYILGKLDMRDIFAPA